MYEKTFAREVTIGLMFCSNSHECFFGKTNELNACELSLAGDCLATSFVEDVKKNSPLLHDEWKKVVESQFSPVQGEGINILIFYGLTKIYSNSGFVVPTITADLVEGAKQLDFGQLVAGLQEIFDDDILVSFGDIDQTHLLSVLRILKMFADGSNQVVGIILD